jgi:hypothetical protein
MILFCGGNSFQATQFRIPTVVIWHTGYFKNKAFLYNSVSSKAQKSHYLPIEINQTPIYNLSKIFKDFLKTSNSNI